MPAGNSPAQRVAVLVACHNDGATIGETLASLRSEPDIELVVIDDGSTDEVTRDALVRAEEEGVRVLRKENGGPSSAWMAGLGTTSPPYVMPFSSDDLLVPGATRLLADALDADPDGGFAWGDMESFGLASAYRPSVPALCPWLVTFTSGIPGIAMFRRSTLLEVGGWRTTDASEDWDLWMRVAAHGIRGAYIPQPIFRYRRGAGGRFRARGSRYEPFYADLREHNAELFERRSENRAASPAPAVLKVLLPVVDTLPGIPRLKKIQIADALTLVFWSGGPRRAAQVFAEGVRFRLRVRAGRISA